MLGPKTDQFLKSCNALARSPSWGILGPWSGVLAFLKADHGPMFDIMMACWIWAKLGPFWGALMKSASKRKSKSFWPQD